MVMLAPRHPAIVPQPFLASALWKARPDGTGFVVVDESDATQVSRSFVVAAYDASAKLTWRKEFPFQPVPLTDSLVQSFATTVFAGRVAANAIDDARRSLEKQLVRPANLPTINGLVVGRDGSIWIERELAGQSSRRWTAISAAGEIVGVMVFPPGARLAYADLGEALTIEQNADGIPQVVRYRVVR
jgi:hypothetical protein